MRKILPRSFYLRPTLKVARDLLGKYLVFENKSGRILEVEAYIGFDDQACHASRGETKRNEVMFYQGGYIYVYLIYGLYYCLNIVTEKQGFPAAVLIRTIEYPRACGPGRLCRAFGITKFHNGLDLTKGPLYIEDRKEKLKKNQILQTPRIGINYAGKATQYPWRFLIKDYALNLERKN